MHSALIVKRIVTTMDQYVDMQVGHKFSLRKWFNSIGEDEYGDLSLSLYHGFYPVFKSTFIPAGSRFNLLELAIIDLNQDMLLIDLKDNMKFQKIRVGYGQPRFEYIEIKGK